MPVKVCLPDSSVYELPNGATGSDLAMSIGPKIKDDAIAVKINGSLFDLNTLLPNNSSVKLITNKDSEALNIIRHSAAHLLAHAVKRLFPNALIGIGPVIEDGFYYDFKVDKFFTTEDLLRIEKEMHNLALDKISLIREEVSRDYAVSKFNHLGETLKVEIISAIPDANVISIYNQGDFCDVCRGPHVPNTDKIKAFKILHTAAAYWRGNENDVQLCRIYGTAFSTNEELDEYLKNLEEAKLRDHRKLGKQLDLFSFQEEASAAPFFHPKGTVIYNELVKFMREHYLYNSYDEVITPMLLDVNLWKTSGHYSHYSENMYFSSVDNKEYALKPMNCPSHCLIYSNSKRSYRDLPIRYADFGRLHRHERSGVTHGLTRVRTFCQDDAHIFCTPEQMKSEIDLFLKFLQNIYNIFNFHKINVKLSTRPEKRLGSDEIWDISEKALIDALEESGIEYTINSGDGAFYGPKIDFEILDALKRPWQLGTLQVDYSMPQRFELKYVKSDGTEDTPIMLHRALLGSLERFMGILIEHCAGSFPTWLSPVQIIILPITNRVHDYAKTIKDKALLLGIRVEVDLRNEKVNAKIRDAQLCKIPYILVVGDRELTSGSVSVRHRSKGDLGIHLVNNFLDTLTKEIRDRIN